MGLMPLIFALGYADIFAWRVIPLHSMRGPACSCGVADCGSPGKHPRTFGGLKDGSIDTVVITDWWTEWPDANVGIVTGPDSGLFVLDVDDGGEETLKGKEKIPPTPEQRTGSGGRHFLFAYPKFKLKNSARALGPGLDTRGFNGYIVAPPSNHKSGGVYEWIVRPREQKLADVPGWIIEGLAEPVVQTPVNGKPLADGGRFWLGKALARVGAGNRNETGFWLACQLRDASIGCAEAELVLRDYAARCPAGDSRYAESEALASVAQAFAHPARAPIILEPIRRKASPPRAESGPASAADELGEQFKRIADGTIWDAGWPWPALTDLTRAVLPGSVVLVCGPPGTGKTYMLLQCLRHWHGNDIDASAFFVEKDRKFYIHRFIAQIEGCQEFTDWKWLKEHSDVAAAAIEAHRDYLNELGQHIQTAPPEHIDLPSMLAWVKEQCAGRRRVILIDPITAVSAGRDRWTADETFMIEAQKAVVASGSSLILVTHPKKGKRVGRPDGDDMAGGTAFFRFSDVAIWLSRRESAPIKMQSALGPFTGPVNAMIHILKSREAAGTGKAIGFEFGRGLEFAEQGVVVRERKKSDDEII